MGDINFPVVGIGASAGGLQALQSFFDHIDSQSDMAFVVINHLAPDKTSSMDELLASHTSMDVKQVKQATEIKPNHVYLIPPSKQLYMEGSKLLLTDKGTEKQAVIDLFFRSMATECEKLSIAVILSGTGSDGTLGLKAVKEHGGVTLVQDPMEASYNGMPRSAIDTDLVDFVLPVEALAQKVMDHKQVLGQVQLPLREEDLSEQEHVALREIFGVLISKKGHDFNHYKRSSILRRLQRRMFVTKSKNLKTYRNYLKEHPEEVNELFQDLLISVTNFFRDGDAFKKLENEVIPKLFKNKKPEDSIRIWVTGCATGEEVYSLAILLHEYAEKSDKYPQIKVFGTDISDEALSVARKAVYPETIATDVTQERLQRYFHKEGAGYRVCEEIKEKVIISNHDVLSDPPFLNQDLISCRNLLIYFNSDLQKEVLKIFHYALRPQGFLFLGVSDSTLGATDLFAPVNKSKAIFKCKQVPASRKGTPRFPLLNDFSAHQFSDVLKHKSGREISFDKMHYSLLAKQFAPASVIIDDNNQVMHSSKGVDKYLHYTEGEPSSDLMKMAKPEVQRSIRNLIFQYEQNDKAEPLSQRIKVSDNDVLNAIKISIQPVNVSGFPEGFRQIIFEEVGSLSDFSNTQKAEANGDVDSEESEIVEQLEEELKQTKQQLQQIVEEYETSNEELMASNEELQSMNEELQTTTEELETSKEELQSVNEELRTVNQELESKVEELKKANDDLKNLMEATEIGIIFVDRELRLQLYTENVKDLFNLIESDVGRPIFDVTNHLNYDHLTDDLKKVINGHDPIKDQLSSTDGRWYTMRIKPYQSTEYDIDGAVITFVDITDLKEAEEELKYQANTENILALFGRFVLEKTDLQEVLDEATKILDEQMDVDFTALLKLNNQKTKLKQVAGTGWSKEQGEKLEISLGQKTLSDYALEKKEPVATKDLKNDDRFNVCEYLLDRGIHSGISVVVKGSEKVFGILSAYSKEPREFVDYEIKFMQNTAIMVGYAVERIKIETELKNIHKELERRIQNEQDLQRDILEVEKKERWRLGQYLHDETAQNLLSIKMLVDLVVPRLGDVDEKALEEIEKIRRMIIRSEKNIRELSHFVLPIEEHKKVEDAFDELIAQTESLYSIECTFSSDGIVGEVKDITTASSLYYITQEAIRNAINHGNADSIDVALTAADDYLQLTIEDNGVGYDPSASNNGRGINIMRHRAELLGGSLEVKQAPGGSGTVVLCFVPLHRIRE